MKKIVKRIFATYMAFMLMLTSAFNTYAADISNDKNIQLIEKFWDCINEDKWSEWTDCFASNVRDEYVSLVSNPKNFENHIGILNVEFAEITDVEKTTKDQIPDIYNKLDPGTVPSNAEAYLVTLNMKVHKDSSYFSNGDNKYLFVIAVSNNIPYVCAIQKIADIPDTIADEPVGVGFNNFIPQPQTITVRYKDNVTIETISFFDFVFNATCNEIGNKGYADNAIIANSVAIKMCGWWCKRGQYFPVGGYDIRYGLVAINNINEASATNQQRIRNIINNTMSYRALSSNGKLFFMNYFAGDYNASGQGSGRMRQNGSSYLANQGYSWDRILRYYYDYSRYNNNGVGYMVLYR